MTQSGSNLVMEFFVEYFFVPILISQEFRESFLTLSLPLITHILIGLWWAPFCIKLLLQYSQTAPLLIAARLPSCCTYPLRFVDVPSPGGRTERLCECDAKVAPEIQWSHYGDYIVFRSRIAVVRT